MTDVLFFIADSNSKQTNSEKASTETSIALELIDKTTEEIQEEADARVDEVKESPTIEGYRNKCEFAIGLNPENRRLTVGFKLDPR